MTYGPHLGGKSLKALFGGTDFYHFRIFGTAEIVGHNPVADDVLAYWQGKCRGEALPRRADIRPEEIRAKLPHIVLLDLVPDADARHGFRLITRLIGTHVAQYFGEITGKDIADMENKAAVKRIYHMSALAREHGQPFLSVVRGYAPGREHLDAYALYLPLSDDGETIDKMMVAVDVRYGEAGE